MHAGTQDFVGCCDVGVGELRQGEVGLHHTPAHMRPGLSTPLGSKLSLTRFVTPASAPLCGSNTATAARTAAGARMSVAWPPVAAAARRIAAAPAAAGGGKGIQTR